jgi:hypothetical protein
MVMVLGLAVGASAFDREVRQIPRPTIEEAAPFSLGGLPAKDFCLIQMYYNPGGWVWIDNWGSYFDSCFAIKNFVDPYVSDFTDCIPPYYPFVLENIWWVMGPFAGDTAQVYDITLDIDIEEPVWDEQLDCWAPGPVIWRSTPITFSRPGGTFWWTGIGLPPTLMYGPFFISIHILDTFGSGGVWYWFLDRDDNNPPLGDDCTPCWTWYELTNYGYPGWWELCTTFMYPGDMWFEAEGRPAHNVAVTMGSFEAVAGDGMVALNWQSLTEMNNSHWFIKRDGAPIAQLEGQGNKQTPTEYTYVDRGLINGVTYSYMIEAVNYQGKVDPYGPVTATPLSTTAVPGEFVLSQNYPNPFNASTVIRYQLASDEHVTLKVYNIYGQEVADLVDADQKAGVYSVHWTGEGISSGVYFYTMTAGDFSQTMKMVFMK